MTVLLWHVFGLYQLEVHFREDELGRLIAVVFMYSWNV